MRNQYIIGKNISYLCIDDRKGNQTRLVKLDTEDVDIICNYRWYLHRKKGIPVYVSSRTNGHILLHRLLNHTSMGLLTDHINGDSFDNRKDNLREANHSSNGRNWHKHSAKSGHRGVYFHKATGKWSAEIGSDKINSHKYLGLFLNKTDAVLAYNKAALEIYGEQARLN